MPFAPSNPNQARLTILFGALLSLACAQPQAHPPTTIYEPKLETYQFNIIGKYTVQHAYLSGVQSIKPVAYTFCSCTTSNEGVRNYTCGDIREENGHIYQICLGRENTNRAYDKDRIFAGYDHISRLPVRSDEPDGEAPLIVNHLHDFDPVVYARFSGCSFTIYLQQSRSMTIASDIAETKRLLDTAWKGTSKYGPVEKFQIGENTWICFPILLPADILADVGEYWYLPIGDGEYYFKFEFGYKSQERANNDPNYDRVRAVWDLLIESFKVTRLDGRVAPAASPSVQAFMPPTINPSPAPSIP